MTDAARAFHIPGVKHSDRTLAKARADRKNRFLGALRIAGTTMQQWAVRHGSTQGYVSNLLAGRRVNADLDRKVDEFIARYAPAKVA